MSLEIGITGFLGNECEYRAVTVKQKRYGEEVVIYYSNYEEMNGGVKLFFDGKPSGYLPADVMLYRDFVEGEKKLSCHLSTHFKYNEWKNETCLMTGVCHECKNVDVVCECGHVNILRDADVVRTAHKSCKECGKELNLKAASLSLEYWQGDITLDDVIANVEHYDYEFLGAGEGKALFAHVDSLQEDDYELIPLKMETTKSTTKKTGWEADPKTIVDDQEVLRLFFEISLDNEKRDPYEMWWDFLWRVRGWKATR